MNIETYADIMMKFYMGLFLFSVFAGAAAIWSKIRKKTFKYWRLIPCTILYSIVAVFNIFIAFIAYDDPADPNYRIYQNWKLPDFILNDIKVLIIWLFIVVLLYLVLRRKEYKTSAKASRKKALIFFAVLLAGAVIWILFTITLSPKREKAYITVHVEASAELCAYTEELLEIEWNDCIESAAGDVEETEYDEEVAHVKLEVKQGYEEEVLGIVQNRFALLPQK